LLGSLQPAVGRFILIASSEGDVTLPIPEITTIYPIGASFWAKLDGSLNMGFNYTRSSGIAQLTLNTETTFRRPAFVVQLRTSATVTEQPGDERDDEATCSWGTRATGVVAGSSAAPRRSKTTRAWDWCSGRRAAAGLANAL
jgi:hypothetical protein